MCYLHSILNKVQVLFSLEVLFCKIVKKIEISISIHNSLQISREISLETDISFSDFKYKQLEMPETIFLDQLTFFEGNKIVFED